MRRGTAAATSKDAVLAIFAQPEATIQQQLAINRMDVGALNGSLSDRSAGDWLAVIDFVVDQLFLVLKSSFSPYYLTNGRCIPTQGSTGTSPLRRSARPDPVYPSPTPNRKALVIECVSSGVYAQAWPGYRWWSERWFSGNKRRP